LNVTSWVRLGPILERKANGRAVQRAGYEVFGE
jgi:hypothetical protein